jgi:hypothetical protein
MVKIVSFSLTEISYAQNLPFQRSCNVSWSKSSVSACLEYWNMSWSKLTVTACLECVIVRIVVFSVAGMCDSLNRGI